MSRFAGWMGVLCVMAACEGRVSDIGPADGALGVDACVGACGDKDAAVAVDASIPADAGIPDAGIPDAGIPDAGSPDAGSPDAGTPDAGAPDAGTPDAGTPDAGTPDAGTPDAGSPDAGTPDAGIPDACTPSCAGANCGGDGCGGSCGTCVGTQTCGGGGISRVCGGGCTPSCAGANCGSDGCGGSCGTCAGTQTCGGGGASRVCGCTPRCAGANCGADGCGGLCGTCAGTQTCGGGGTPQVCGCTPESDSTFCSRGGQSCGPLTALDSCGVSRTVTCGWPTGTPFIVQPLGNQSMVAPIGTDSSQYSLWLMHEAGWQSYISYYCKNSPINNVWRDRVWRMESWTDGKSQWTNDQVVLEGALHQADDLSCSPGVVIDSAGVWHMYYVAADRDAPMNLYLLHATASAPGTQWTKRGQVTLNGYSQPFGATYLETPSPMLEQGRIVLYMVFAGGALYRTESTDGTNFSTPERLSAPDSVQAGRVRKIGSRYYYAYSHSPTSAFAAPTRISLSVSNDGRCFSPPVTLMNSNGSGWDANQMWAPDLWLSSGELRVYYAGNSGTYPWWGTNSALGVRWFTP